jgi:hypothetical protein
MGMEVAGSVLIRELMKREGWVVVKIASHSCGGAGWLQPDKKI